MGGDYQQALEAAGARIIVIEQFGSYQGSWYAKVEYNDQSGWIKGSYGSCSGCDAIYGEFNFEHHEHKNDSWYDTLTDSPDEESATCETCIKTRERFADFGKDYLANLLSYEEVLAQASEDLGWDMEAEEVVKFLEANKE